MRPVSEPDTRDDETFSKIPFNKMSSDCLKGRRVSKKFVPTVKIDSDGVFFGDHEYR